jgi:hypothetical protein
MDSATPTVLLLYKGAVSKLHKLLRPRSDPSQCVERKLPNIGYVPA